MQAILTFLGICMAVLTGIAIGVLWAKTASTTTTRKCTCSMEATDNVARIPLANIQREFTYSSPFSQPPPSDGHTSEPIWDSLIPSKPPSNY
jgi:hypothetical protein